MNNGTAVILTKPKTISAVALFVNVVSKALGNEQKLIDQQIFVYLAWLERHKGWRLYGEEECIEKFVEYAKVEDVDDITSEMVNLFLLTAKEEGGGDYIYRHAKTAIYRFLRFYQARTKGFTSNPRSVIFK